MAKRTNTDTGRPAGNKPAQGTGIPTKITDNTRAEDQRVSDTYTADEERISGSVPQRHPNRNTRKGKEDLL